MKCPKCQTENPDKSQFCSSCGTQLLSAEDVAMAQEETIQAPKQELTTGSTFAGRYQVVEELGKGGMGKVYKVFDKEVNAKVALKLIKPEVATDEKTIERFRNELKTARDISHKNVCRMYDLNKEEGSYYITMEYVSGEDLKRMIRMMGQLSSGKAISVARQVCEGLVEAHRLGVVHRDLKPQNIMIDREGNARIMDFGIARSLKAKGITDKGLIIGTPEYMSLEQVEGKGVDHRSDIYSLGIILYEMTTGRVPFEGETPLSIAMKQKSDAPKDPRSLNPQIPEDLNRVILTCLEKDRDKRYQKAEELLAELKNLEKGIPTTEKVLPTGKPTTSQEITVTFKKRWAFIGILFLVIIIAGLSIIYFINKEPAPPSVSSGEELKEKKMLVVLPFENLGPPEDEYFADGITEEFTARLASISELGVIARASANQYKNTEKSIKTIGEELGVDYILQGSIRWQKEAEGQGKVRVTPQLVKVSDGTHIWASVYDQPINDVFQVQSDIAKQVVNALDITLLDPERKKLEKKPTDNPQAYGYYLRGKNYMDLDYPLEKRYPKAVQMFEKAVELDPDFAQAYATLSKSHSGFVWYYLDRSEERLEKAKAAAEKALELDPDLAEAHLALGYYYYWGKMNYNPALEQFAIAQKLQPNNYEILEAIAYVQRRQGKLEEALANFEKAAELAPQILFVGINETLLLLRRYAEAEQHIDHYLNFRPDAAYTYASKSHLYLQWQGNTTKARMALEDASKRVSLTDNGWIILVTILVDLYDRNYQGALDTLNALPVEIIEFRPFYYPKAQLMAQIYGLTGQKELKRQYYESARDILESKIKEDPDDARLHSSLGIVYGGLDRKEDAIQEGKHAVELLPAKKDALRHKDRLIDLAKIYAMVGEYDKAIDKIEYLLSVPCWLSVPLLKLDPVWDPLRDHPRFQKLVEEKPD
jgi:serine/threonine protein kinase/Tfp pilus assembly protein PilF